MSVTEAERLSALRKTGILDTPSEAGFDRLNQARKAVAEESRLLQLAEAMSGVGHWRYNVADMQLAWSDEVYRIHGVERSSFDPNLGQGVAFYHPDDQAVVSDFVARGVSHGEDFTFQLRLKRMDGELRDVVCKGACEIDGAGATTALFGVFQDVTDQVRTLQSVERSEARYRFLTENANDMVTEMDGEGRFTYASPAATTVTGYAVDEIVGKIAMNFIHPDDHERVRAAFDTALKGPGGWRIEYRTICKDGRVIWVEARPTVVRDPATGRMVAVTDVIRDITDRKAAEDARMRSEARYRRLADNASDIVTESDLHGRFTYVSPAVTAMTGYNDQEIVGRSAMDFVHPDDVERVTREIREALGAPSGKRIEHRHIRKDGQVIWVESRPTLVRDPLTKAPFAVTDVMRDITDRKALESDLRHARAEAEAAAAVKSEFLANMSHELRTPLTSILGFSKLLSEQSTLGDEGRRYVQRVSDASQALLTTVNDILNFSKLEAGQVEISARPVDPAAIVKGALELLAPQADAKGLYQRVECEGLPPLVMADDARLRQILLNLISNAVKFTATGGVTVSARYDDATQRLRCEVIDTGAGVPADRLDRLFKRFSQVDASTTRSHGGTGLGLAICKGLAEAMGGTVGADSVEGKGSRFWVQVPCAVVASASPTKPVGLPASAAVEASKTIRGMRVLVADDNAVNRQLIGIILGPFGVVLTEVEDGAQAIDLVQATLFDLILMDIRMPGVDGPSAATAIRKGGGVNRATPIIAFTAEANDRRMSQAWASIFDDQLPKPIMAADLITTLAVWNPENGTALLARKSRLR